MQKSIIHKAPIFILTMALVIGILIESRLNELPPFFYLASALITLAIIVSQFLKLRKHKRISNIIVWFYFFFFLCIGMLRYQQDTQSNDFTAGINSSYTATILTSPIAKSNSYRVDINIDTAYCNNQAYYINTPSIAYVEYSEQLLQLQPGDRITFNAYLNPPSAALNPEAFDYKSYLKRKNIFATTYIKNDQWTILSEKRTGLYIIANRIQYTIVGWLKEANFGPDELSILAALTVGYKQLIAADQRQEYITAGVTHVLAVSGLHVGIIFIFLCKIFTLFRKRRKLHWLSYLFIIILLWGFALITGLSPSVTRSTLMFTFVSIGLMGKRRSNIFNTVFISAFFLLFINPQLLFDIGFQLSYCAVLGIISFQPYFLTFFHKRLKIPKFIAELLGVSLAAQIGTAPISIHVFNCFPVYFLLTNIWIIPLVGLIVNVAVVFIILNAVGISSTIIAAILQFLLKVMNTGVHYINELPHPLISPLYIDRLTVIGIYILILLLLFSLIKHSKRLLFSSLFISILLLSWQIISLNNEKSQHQLFMFHDYKHFNICIQDGLNSVILCDDTLSTPNYFIHHHIGGKGLETNHLTAPLSYPGIKLIKDFIIMPNSLYAIYSEDIERYDGLASIDALIINTAEPKNIYKFYEQLEFDTLIIFNKTQKNIAYYESFCKKNAIQLHYIKKDGYYHISLR